MGNLWYADPRGFEVELTIASNYSAVGGTPFQYPAGNQPYGIFIDQKTGARYVTDESCKGNVFVNRVLTFSVGDPVEGVVLSNKNPSKTNHLYVGNTGLCSHTAAHVLDLTDGMALPGLGSQSDIPGIAKNLYFTDYNKRVWKTSDTV